MARCARVFEGSTYTAVFMDRRTDRRHGQYFGRRKHGPRRKGVPNDSCVHGRVHGRRFTLRELGPCSRPCSRAVNTDVQNDDCVHGPSRRPCLRAVNMGVQNDDRVHGPCSRPCLWAVNTGVQNDDRIHGPCRQPENTAMDDGSVNRAPVLMGHVDKKQCIARQCFFNTVRRHGCSRAPVKNNCEHDMIRQINVRSKADEMASLI